MNLKRKFEEENLNVKKTKMDIPDEIIYTIISYLTPKYVVVSSGINSTWNKICKSNLYWENHFKNSFSLDTHKNNSYYVI